MILLAMIPENPVVGGTVLRRAAIQSPNFVTGSAGWSVNQDGSAEFNNLVIRNGQIISGTALFYSGPAAAGNLIASVAAAGGTDSKGNAYLAGITTYDTSLIVACNLDGGVIDFYSAASEAGPWTSIGFYSGQTGIIQSSTAGPGQIALRINTTNVLLATLSGVTAFLGLSWSNGATGDTLTVGQLTATNSGGNPLIQATQTGAGGGTAVVRIQVNNLGDLNLSTLVSGDSAGRIVLDSSANLAARIRLGPGNASPDCTFGRSSAGLLASDYLAFNNAGAESWNAVTFANSWANAASGANLRYKRVASPDHCVALVGRITAPAGVANGQNVITALPAAYQPNNQQDIAAWDNTAVKPLRFQMGTNGVLTYQAGGAVAADSIDIYPCFYSLDA